MTIALSGGVNPLKPTYANALTALGHTCLTLYPGETLPACCEALLLTGGADIHPVRFGLTLLPDGCEQIETARDDHEFRLFAHALEARLPILGICRGMQLINIALGGDIWQDIPTQLGLYHKKGDGSEPLWHEVTREDKTLRRVNSYHHQAVRRLGYGLHAAAFSPDGLTEALRHESLPIAAVQWHPELMEDGMRELLGMLPPGSFS